MSTMLPHEHGDDKIQGWHRDRLAVIYVRQSSRQQVLDHGESTRLQYGLTGRAAALGWPASRVMVIDEDLGRSAANAAERPGFARLVAEITMGHVGLVLGLEMSRLAREGPALLGGLVACGICGHRLQVSYEASGQGLTGRYCCQRRHHTYGEPRCQQMAARFLDDHVAAQVLSALAPAALELSVTAAAQAGDRRAEVDRIWRQRLERAGFACDRARRQYQLAEPENRLVARQLEREWEAALAERAHLGEEYERYQRQRPARLSAAELAAIRALASDIPALWAAPTTTVADRKRLLRAVIESVQVTADGATERVHAAITWAGGQQTHADLRRPVARIDQLSYYPALTERITALAGQGLAGVSDDLDAG